MGGLTATRRRPGQRDEQLSGAAARNASRFGDPAWRGHACRAFPWSRLRTQRHGSDLRSRTPATHGIYFSDDPPRGWTSSQWPTPLPDTDQLKNYRFFIENLTKLPGW